MGFMQENKILQEAKPIIIFLLNLHTFSGQKKNETLQKILAEEVKKNGDTKLSPDFFRGL